MHLDYVVTEQDFISAAKLVIQTRSKTGKWRTKALVVLGAFFVCGSLILVVTNQSRSSAEVCFVFGIVLLLTPFSLRHALRKQYRNNPILQGPRTLDLDDAGLHFKSAFGESMSTWAAYSKFAENDKVFILFQQGNQIFVPIPKIGLSEDQCNGIRSLLKLHLQN